MTEFDVVCVGAGPAGSAAAYELARSGAKVLVIEKESLPRYKTCGGGVVGRAQQHLNLDIAEIAEHTSRRVQVKFWGEDLTFSGTRQEAIISLTMRDRFDLALVLQAVSAGAELRTEAALVGLEFQRNGIRIQTSRGQCTTGWVIGADGATGPTARLAGWSDRPGNVPALEWEVETSQPELLGETRFDFDTVPKGYSWVFPKRDHLSIGAVSMSRGQKGLEAYLHRYLERLGLGGPVRMTRHAYVIPLKPRSQLCRRRVLLTGDAAGLVDPLSAEGISAALLSGRLAAQAVLEAPANEVEVARRYSELMERYLLRDLRVSQRLAGLLYGAPGIRNRLIRGYGQNITERLVDVFTGKTTYGELLDRTASLRPLLDRRQAPSYAAT